uniref:leucine--tRNA ligase n=1 Tax=Panagrellus redivivus TaxID=6233 RepID=A0A7E4UWU7_PANRE
MLAYKRYAGQGLSFRKLFVRSLATKPYLQWPLDADTKCSNSLHDIEGYWSERLSKAVVGVGSETGEKKYVLSMFPYPSGMLHMGHMRVYSISDVLSRYYKLNGYNVIHPIGWDGFGLPAENAAIERGIDPKEWTYANAAAMKEQLLRTGIQFDWDREIFTCDPSFYKWTQWIFLKLYEADLVHRTVAEVNWDPIDQTVLAEEQIDGHGNSWRSGAKAEKRKLAQWMIETPKYAKRLADGLAALRSDWKEIADIQDNWIGKCDVYRFVLPLKDGRTNREFEKFDLRVVDPSEIANARFVVVSRDHPLVRELKKPPTDITVLPPTVPNFVTGKPMPIVVLSEALAEQDNAAGVEYVLKARLGRETDIDVLAALKLKPLEKPVEISTEEVLKLAEKHRTAGYLTSRTLVDWVVSRQRGWGTPIPMAITKKGDAFPVEEVHLPVLTEHRGDEFHSRGKVGHLETDTLDTFFDSTWYYLRFLDPKNDKTFADKEITSKLMPVDVYVGGVEHAAVHMFFARFVSYFLHDLGLVSYEEPFDKLVPQGIVRGRTFIDPNTGAYVLSEDVEQSSDGESFVHAKTGAIIEAVFEKMSKSKHNGVDPIEVINRDGTDLARLQLLHAASPKANLDWGVTDLKGLKTWIDRVAWAVNAYIDGRKAAIRDGKKAVPKDVEKVYRESYNYFVRNTSMLLEVLRIHNTAISRLQGLTNALRKVNPEFAGQSVEYERCVHALVVMLQVFAPNLAAELWSALSQVEAIDSKTWNHKEDVIKQQWPQVDADADVDFCLSAFDISCGRIPVGRQLLEKASDAEIVELAKKQYHQTFFGELTKAGINIADFAVVRRDGFHVTVELKLAEGATEESVRNVLDSVGRLRMKAAKDAKKNRTKVRKAIAEGSA